MINPFSDIDHKRTYAYGYVKQFIVFIFPGCMGIVCKLLTNVQTNEKKSLPVPKKRFWTENPNKQGRMKKMTDSCRSENEAKRMKTRNDRDPSRSFDEGRRVVPRDNWKLWPSAGATINYRRRRPSGENFSFKTSHAVSFHISFTGPRTRVRFGMK